jgi:Na+/melibiose symporter-like transporter
MASQKTRGGGQVHEPGNWLSRKAFFRSPKTGRRTEPISTQFNPTCKMRKNIFHVILGSIILLIWVISVMVSPYDYAWEPAVKQIDDDSVLVLRLSYILIVVLCAIGAILAKRGKAILFYSGMACVVLYQLIQTLSL